MQPIVFKSDSWHYKLACRVGYKYWRSNLELCGYVRWVLWGMVLAVIGTAVALAMLYAAGDAIAWWLAMLVSGSAIHAGFGAGLFTVSLIALGIIVAVGWTMLIGAPYVSAWLKRTDIELTPSFIVEAYRSFKTKTCRRIDFQ